MYNLWTSKVFVLPQLLNYMRDNNVAKVVPRKDPDDGIKTQGFNGNLTSGYFARSRDIMPKQGDRLVLWYTGTTRKF